MIDGRLMAQKVDEGKEIAGWYNTLSSSSPALSQRGGATFQSVALTRHSGCWERGLVW